MTTLARVYCRMQWVVETGVTWQVIHAVLHPFGF